VEQVGAVVLQVDALAGGVGGDEDPQGVVRGVGVEGVLDFLAGVVAHAAVEGAMRSSAWSLPAIAAASWCIR
jgi:hypothetical protein